MVLHSSEARSHADLSPLPLALLNELADAKAGSSQDPAQALYLGCQHSRLQRFDVLEPHCLHDDRTPCEEITFRLKELSKEPFGQGHKDCDSRALVGFNKIMQMAK